MSKQSAHRLPVHKGRKFAPAPSTGDPACGTPEERLNDPDVKELVCLATARLEGGKGVGRRAVAGSAGRNAVKRFLVRVPFVSGLNSGFDWFGRVEWDPPGWATLARHLPSIG